AKQLGSRRQLMFSGTHGKIDSGPGGHDIDAIFPLDLLNQQLHVAVSVPKTMEMQIGNSADALTFEFSSPLLFQLLERPQVSGVFIPIPSRLLLQKVTISDDHLNYAFKASPSDLPVTIDLDLRKDGVTKIDCTGSTSLPLLMNILTVSLVSLMLSSC